MAAGLLLSLKSTKTRQVAGLVLVGVAVCVVAGVFHRTAPPESPAPLAIRPVSMGTEAIIQALLADGFTVSWAREESGVVSDRFSIMRVDKVWGSETVAGVVSVFAATDADRYRGPQLADGNVEISMSGRLVAFGKPQFCEVVMSALARHDATSTKK